MDNMAKNDNNRFFLHAVSMQAVRKSTEDNERTKTARKGIMLAEVLTVK